jgi:Neuraminidase (sialidase)
MKLFEINEAIADLINFETGEILDVEAFDNLKLERQDKLTNIALLYKNMTSDAKQLKELEKEYSDRRKRCEKTAEWCKETLARELNGEKLEDEKKRFKISWRPSERLEIVDPSIIASSWVTYEPKYDKAGMKEAIKAGISVEGAVLTQTDNIQIK